jgi:2-dehydro-3-deoxyphosphogluconate aldolase / (4S)-4-hydroxy-2-oxoglutarate aldolase
MGPICLAEPQAIVSVMTPIREELFEAKIIAIIRGHYSESDCATIVASLVEGGVRALELTANSPGWEDHLKAIKSKYGKDLLLGAGTITRIEQAKVAFAAGAKFIVSPHFDPELVQWCLEYVVEPIPGVITPTEIVNAIRAGASLVKLFPAGHFGPEYVRALRAPLNEADFMVTGGVDHTNIRHFFDAGARTAGIGGKLVPKTVTDKDGRDPSIVQAARELFAAL